VKPRVPVAASRACPVCAMRAAVPLLGRVLDRGDIMRVTLGR
jgi:hypothetical protein